MKRTFMGLSCTLLSCGALVTLCADSAGAQPQASKEDQAMDLLRAGTPSERDNTIVDAWVNAELSRLRGQIDQPLLVGEAVATFIDRFRAQYNHAENSGQFKQKLAERTGAVFALEFAKGKDLEVVGRAAATVLVNMEDANTQAALVAGLASTNQVVRYLCCGAVVQLHAKIAADAQLTAQILQAIGKAGAAEMNGVAMMRLYQAAGFEDRVAVAVPVMLAMMDARLVKMRVAARDLDRAEVAAVEYFEKAETGRKLDATLRGEIVKRLAPLLRIHSERFAAPSLSEAERAAITATIVRVEKLLARITKPVKAPDVAGALQKSMGADAAINMEIELLQWIGSEQAPGLLNAAPWNVPVGAP